ncbi:MAG: CofH family radical SAM protein [Bacteroidales bacterium]|nr:CofH family radical SAM protein [Bacteroidales bacterium]MCB8999222.1 CofH family radical SAM protein [Bacteroidales bacterium]
MKTESIVKKALKLSFLTHDEALHLYNTLSGSELMWLANEIRKIKVPGPEVGWIIDRNINITNVCSARCKFCNFHRIPNDPDTYITSMEEYTQKIEELFKLGGDQVLLQGGLNPKLGLNEYSNLFKELKQKYPSLKLHALGPPEIHFLARKEKKSYREILIALMDSGLDSLPGAGAEILCDEVRKKISGGKCGSDEWLDVMRVAHKLNLPTSATMMYGHVETKEQRIEHLLKIRDLQAEKPEGTYGFVTFVPWPFQSEDTRLSELFPGDYAVDPVEYIRLLAISRIVLSNIDHIQASWLTVGLPVAQLCLHGGADDLGSIMIEENVVSTAGASFRTDAEGITAAIRQAGFRPRFRNQKYESVNSVN